MTPYRWVLVSLCAVGLVGSLTFVLRYTYMSKKTKLGPWWKHEIGWWLAIVPINLSTLFILVILNNMNAQWPGRGPTTLILFSTYVVETWWPYRLMSKLNRPLETVVDGEVPDGRNQEGSRGWFRRGRRRGDPGPQDGGAADRGRLGRARDWLARHRRRDRARDVEGAEHGSSSGRE